MYVYFPHVRNLYTTYILLCTYSSPMCVTFPHVRKLFSHVHNLYIIFSSHVRIPPFMCVIHVRFLHVGIRPWHVQWGYLQLCVRVWCWAEKYSHVAVFCLLEGTCTPLYLHGSGRKVYTRTQPLPSSERIRTWCWKIRTRPKKMCTWPQLTSEKIRTRLLSTSEKIRTWPQLTCKIYVHKFFFGFM